MYVKKGGEGIPHPRGISYVEDKKGGERIPHPRGIPHPRPGVSVRVVLIKLLLCWDTWGWRANKYYQL